MESVGVVVADPGEDCLAGLFSGFEAGLCDEFAFERREERFADAVVPAVPYSSNGLSHLMVF